MYLIQNIQVPMQSYYLKLLNMCKFAHDRKTRTILVPIPPKQFKIYALTMSH